MVKRPRRLRNTAALRVIVAEAAIRPEQLLVPFFVVPGSHEVQPIAALPGVARYSVDKLLGQLELALALGVRSVMLFGVVPNGFKTPGGEAAAAENSPVAQAIRAARAAFGNDLVIISDICLCAYTDHGHCGLLRSTPRGVVIDNDLSLAGLAAMALVHAEAGVDLVAPSDMMDGRVAAIRQALDAQGFTEVGILSYAVKYASAFYGPFREAAGSAPTPPSPP
ncbi:MAG: porphobilinogen synthase, partial [Truepera sp.]|nr:porphobilinogen synthase [Truepera sp.]